MKLRFILNTKVVGLTDASDVAVPSKVKVDGRLMLDDLPDAVFKAKKRSLLFG
jgi:hypothetical protein